MIMTGHKTRSVFERYNTVRTSDLDQAAKRLDEVPDTVTGTVGLNGYQAEVAITRQHAVESASYNKRTRSSVG